MRTFFVSSLFFGKALLCGLSMYTLVSTSFAEVMVVPELNLEKAICQSLGVSRDNLTQKLVEEELTSLDASSMEIRDLTGLEFAKNLEILVLSNNLIEDISPISNLASITKLDLSGNRIRNLSGLVPLSGSKMRKEVADFQLSLEDRKISRSQKNEVILKMSEVVERLKLGPWALRELNISGNRLLGLSGIEHLTDLVFLNVSKNALIDLEGLSKMKTLVTLYAQENQLGRVESYVDENKNKSYDLGEPIEDQSGNGKRDTDPLIELKSLPQLTNLYLYNNLLTSLDSIEDLPRLKTFFVSGNKIRDISKLQFFPSLVRLSLSNNQITDLSGLRESNRLQQLFLVENRISDLRPLQGLISLKELHLQRNLIVNPKPIESLSGLEVLSVSYNLISQGSFFRELNKLKRLSLSYNCLRPEDSELVNDIQRMKSNGTFVTLGKQRKRIIEAELLSGFLSGYPQANQELGDYLSLNGYNLFMDFVEDSKVSDEVKSASILYWLNTLKRGKKLEDFDFLAN